MAELDVDKVGWFSENILNNIFKKTYYKEVCRKFCSREQIKESENIV